MNPSSHAAIDQADAFVREQARRQGVDLYCDEDRQFAAGVSFGIGLVLRWAHRDLPAAAFELGEAWQARVKRRFDV